MALGKLRVGSNKRPSSSSPSSSSSSYASAITITAFIALCVLGVWILTSDSVAPLQTSAKAAIPEILKKDSPGYEDAPEDLPDDAIKSERQKDSTPDKSTEDSEKREHSDDDATERQFPRTPSETEDPKVDRKLDAARKDSESKEDDEDEKQQQSPEHTATASHDGVQEEKTESREQEEEKNPKSGMNEKEHSRTQEPLEQTENVELKDEVKPKSDLEEKRKPSTQGKPELQSGLDEEKETQTEKDEEKRQTFKVQLKDANSETRVVEKSRTQGKKEEEEQTEKSQLTTAVKDAKKSGQKEEFGTIQEAKSEESFPDGSSGNSDIPKESKESKKSWSTQADQSENQKERRKDDVATADGSIYGYTWRLCNVTAGADYIPCLDNEKALKQLRSRKHFEHRERHCPEESPTCLVPMPDAYKKPIPWPTSRDKIWYHNVPNKLLAEVKGHQNWVKMTGEFLTFPGGGTQFIHGALHYIDFLQTSVPEIAWGKKTRVVLDVGCGVASFGGFLFERDVLTMSFAPKDEHEAQVQFALERGIPAISAVMGSQRLPFPSRVFDLLHCARCRVPWHADGGLLLLELNRILRPGGYFVWSATPVYQKLQEDVQIWKEMSALTASMCWEVVSIQRDKINSIGAAIYQKPTTNECYDRRKHKRPLMCTNDDDPNAAWYVPLHPCMHHAPVGEKERGSQWPKKWPLRLQQSPYWLNSSQMGVYGKPAPEDFKRDYEHWKRVVNNFYLNGLGITWPDVRNVMDMRAVYGGFAAAMKDLKIWVLNVVNVNSPDTLPIIFERGLFGIYHDWCESFSTYPRTYDLLHADHVFSRLKKRCKLVPVMAEIDRMLRPGGMLIVRDESAVIGEAENLLKSMHWKMRLTFSKDKEGILSAQKSEWRPTDSYVKI